MLFSILFSGSLQPGNLIFAAATLPRSCPDATCPVKLRTKTKQSSCRTSTLGKLMVKSSESANVGRPNARYPQSWFIWSLSVRPSSLQRTSPKCNCVTVACNSQSLYPQASDIPKDEGSKPNSVILLIELRQTNLTVNLVQAALFVQRLCCKQETDKNVGRQAPFSYDIPRLAQCLESSIKMLSKIDGYTWLHSTHSKRTICIHPWSPPLNFGPRTCT